MAQKSQADAPDLRECTMKDDNGDVLCVLHEFIDFDEEAVRGRVVCALDVPAVPVVVPDVDDGVVFVRNLVGFDNRC